MSNLAKEKIVEALKAITHPEMDKSLFDLEMLVDFHSDPDKLVLDPLTHASPVRAELERLVRAALPGSDSLSIEFRVCNQTSTQPALGGGILQNVKNVVAIASGKGGVGKSTVAANVAASLAMEGARVGLLDADIYGPSVPALLGVEQSSVSIRDQRIVPVERHGMKIISMGFLTKPGESIIWRGPMLHKIIEQFCGEVAWGDLDFLIVDLPPGTGDVSLSLSQLVPLGGAVVVSTPQHVAIGVATKAANMFQKLNVPLLGLVENMSYYSCPSCGNKDDVFGHGGAQAAAKDLDIPFLGEIPLNSAIKLSSDKGEPVVTCSPDSAPAQAFRRVAQLIAGRLSVAALVGYEAIGQRLPDWRAD